VKVAMLAPIAWRTPPVHYGPWELVTSLITEGLVALGVDVTLFASADSVTTATLDSVTAVPYADHPEVDGRVAEALHVAHVLHRSGDFDLVHNNLDWLPLSFIDLCTVPMVTTVHGFSNRAILPAYRHAGSTGRSSLISISDSDRVPDLEYAATIHHGIDLDLLPFSAAGGEDLVILGRISPEKGTAEAVEIARLAGRRLVICGIVQDREYFHERVEPHIDDDSVVYLGSVAPTQRAAVLGSALALLHPIAFAEPFGLSVVESMACGTPVVAYRLGSMPEVVDEGVTGFLVDDATSAAAAVEAVRGLNRARCRAVAAARFSADRMVRDYLAVYEQVLGRRGG
jgi:glycosyltransferase involved in cell wall biosynthesis